MVLKGLRAFLNSKWAVILVEYYNKKGGDYSDPRTPNWSFA